MALVLYSKDLGVFLGNGLGLAYWSEVGTAAQDFAPCFATPDEVGEIVRSWGPIPRDIAESLVCIAVVPDVQLGERTFASASACAKAGLPGWLTKMSSSEQEWIFGERQLVH